MYIPSLLFGATNKCVDASGHDETGIFYSGSQTWEYYKFSTLGSGSFTINSGSSTEAKVFIVAGGGAGGFTVFNGEALNESAGGGGAGGVAFTDARIGPGTYNLYIGDGSNVSGSEGEDSWIDNILYPDEFGNSYAYVTSGSRLTAEGGGFGGYFIDGTLDNGKEASSGGSGGGGCASLRKALPAEYDIALPGSGRPGQGFGAGTPIGNLCEGSNETTATGGGGALTSSEDTDCFSSAGYQTPGADGLFFNVDGTLTEYSCGGASMRKGTWEAATNDTQIQTSRMYGAGGWGSSTSYGSSKYGRQGIIVIMIPVCYKELSECTTYNLNGGVYGGNITYVSCVNGELLTSAIGSQQTTSMCSYPGIAGFPSASGDVTITSAGSCGTTIPPAPAPEIECIAQRFTSGQDGSIATYTLCGGINPTSESIDNGLSVDVCTVSGSAVSLSGAGGSVTELGDCTPVVFCDEYRFTAGENGGTATYYECGDGSRIEQVLSASTSIDRCIITGSYKSITGANSSITFLSSDCT